MLCHAFSSQVEYKIVCFIPLKNSETGLILSDCGLISLQVLGLSHTPVLQRSESNWKPQKKFKCLYFIRLTALL